MLTLVTGATGLVGNNVVRMLLDRGQSVRVLQRATSDPRPLAGLEVETARGDVRDAESVVQACRGVERVIHAAGYVHIGWSNQELHQSINVAGTRNVAEAALASGARLVHVSSVDALGLGTRTSKANEDSPPDLRLKIPYMVTKRDAELTVLSAVARGLDAVIVNPTFMLGPWDWKPSSGRMLLELAAQPRLFFTPRGGNDFCDVRDVVTGILSAAERGQTGRRYILGGESLSYLDAWKVFARIIGKPGPVCRAGPLMIRTVGFMGDMKARVTGREPDVNSAATGMSALYHHFSYARAATELGYAPRPAAEAAQAAWDWFREHGYVAQS